MCAPKPKSRRESKINLAGDDVTTRCDVMVVGDMIRDAPTGITGSVAFFRAERCVAVGLGRLDLLVAMPHLDYLQLLLGVHWGLSGNLPRRS